MGEDEEEDCDDADAPPMIERIAKSDLEEVALVAREVGGMYADTLMGDVEEDAGVALITFDENDGGISAGLAALFFQTSPCGKRETGADAMVAVDGIVERDRAAG